MNLNLTKQTHIGILTFDRQDSSANIFDRAVLEELNSLLDQIGNDSTIESLIITSAKPTIFIAGADLKSLSTSTPAELKSLITLGQSVFNKLEALPITTVAAIHGACVGGGFELALACDYRVASDASCTRIGLPETQLGILPAWGGSTRLPALIGLPTALPLILSGKLLKPIVAKKKGLINEICPKENLQELAERYIHKPKQKLPLHLLAHNPISVAIIRKKATDNLYEKTHGHYPALTTALKVACDGVRTSLDDSLKNERDAIVSLTNGPEAKELINLFFLTERSKKLKPTDTPPKKLPNTAVIGSGIMGSGIAYWLSTRGHNVILKDINHDALAKGMGTIQKLYNTSVSRRILSKTEATTSIDHIVPTIEPISLTDRDIIIEAATENLELKKKIFTTLSEQAGPETILATNTSALPIHEISKVITNPERLVGIHFFNPVPRMKLVEVVQTETTSPQTLASAVKFVQSIGKLPVVVQDSPGFVVNRILLPYLVRAGELFTQGADPKQIDKAMLDFGMPMGPLRLLDEVGLDVGIHVAQTLADAFPDRMTVPLLLTEMVEKGLHGRKTGKGFYIYGKKGDPTPNPEALALQKGNLNPSNIQDELVHLMSKEAALCLEEGIAATPQDIDFAMVMGTGYAPFRGGPLKHAHNTNMLDQKFY